MIGVYTGTPHLPPSIDPRDRLWLKADNCRSLKGARQSCWQHFMEMSGNGKAVLSAAAIRRVGAIMPRRRVLTVDQDATVPRSIGGRAAGGRPCSPDQLGDDCASPEGPAL